MKVKAAFTILVFCLSFSCNAQLSASISQDDKEVIVDKVSDILSSKFLFETDAVKMASLIVSKLNNGEYDSITNVSVFCRTITSDLRSIKNDKHLFVFYSPEEALEVKAHQKLLPKNELRIVDSLLVEAERKENFGFKEIKILNGNIGYLKLSYFSNPRFFNRKVDVSMRFLEDTQAMIIDLRDNGGGEGSALLASYFLPQKEVILSLLKCRDSLQNSITKSVTNIKGKRYLNKDVFILTNTNTFSAAEDFAYTLKHLKRATIIGERTKGGAHPVDIINIHRDVLIQLPICESCNFITKSNWEQTGVIPHIQTPSDNAFDVAYIKAIENRINRTIDESSKTELELLKKEINFKFQNE